MVVGVLYQRPGTGLRLGGCLLYRFADTGGPRFPGRCRRSIATILQIFLCRKCSICFFCSKAEFGKVPEKYVCFCLTVTRLPRQIPAFLNQKFPSPKDVSIAFPAKFLQLRGRKKGALRVEIIKEGV